MSNSMPVIAQKESLAAAQVLDLRSAAAAASAADVQAKGTEPAEEATPEQVEGAVAEINTSLQTRSISLQFEVDKDTDKLIVKVVDKTNGVVIRQIPNEEVIHIAKVMGKAPGLLVNGQA